MGKVVEPYDSDKNYPVFGFGGIPAFMGTNDVSHCFPLNGNNSNYEIHGFEGILEYYRKNLPQITLYGPTLFGSIIEKQIEMTKAKMGSKTYNVLLILTDGEIHDMEKTVELVVQASELPMSIIIIGVGDEQFEMMKSLDSDKHIIRDKNGKAALRDIVQFVKFKNKKFKNSDELAEKVLKEIPDQLIDYMMLNKIGL